MDNEVMESNVNVSNNNVPKKSKGPIIVIILLLIIIAGLGTFIYLKKDVLFNNNINTNNTNTNNTSNNENSKETKDDTKKEITDNVKKELLKIVGLTENGYKRLDEETIRELELTGKDYADLSHYNVGKVFIFLDEGNYNSNDLPTDVKKDIIKIVGFSEGLMKWINEDTFSAAISQDNYKKIAKKYGFSEDGKTIFSNNEFENGYFLYMADGIIFVPYKIDDSVTFDSSENDIKLIYNVKLSDIDDKNPDPDKNLNKKITFSFKQNTDNEYYLYNIDVKDIK